MGWGGIWLFCFGHFKFGLWLGGWKAGRMLLERSCTSSVELIFVYSESFIWIKDSSLVLQSRHEPTPKGYSSPLYSSFGIESLDKIQDHGALYWDFSQV